MQSSDFGKVASKKPTIYLAGAIRDDHVDSDVKWREDIITACHDLAVFFNPLAGMSFNRETRIWDQHELIIDANLIVHRDFWWVDHCDILLANFSPLSQGYPSIGALIEFGRATGNKKCLRYSIVDPDYIGHGNTALFKLHPFIEKNSSIVFKSVNEVIEKLPWLLSNLSGLDPHFHGTIG